MLTLSVLEALLQLMGINQYQNTTCGWLATVKYQNRAHDIFQKESVQTKSTDYYQFHLALFGYLLTDGTVFQPMTFHGTFTKTPSPQTLRLLKFTGKSSYKQDLQHITEPFHNLKLTLKYDFAHNYWTFSPAEIPLEIAPLWFCVLAFCQEHEEILSHPTSCFSFHVII
jgi:hypothetical protein